MLITDVLIHLEYKHFGAKKRRDVEADHTGLVNVSQWPRDYIGGYMKGAFASADTSKTSETPWLDLRKPWLIRNIAHAYTKDDEIVI